MVDLAALRQSLRTLAPGAVPLEGGGERRPAGLTSGFAELDGALEAGGFPRGAVSELRGAPSSGKTTIALTAIAAHRGLAVLVDGGHQFFPPAAAALGVALDRLLIVRPAGLAGEELTAAAAAAAEIVARSGAFGLIAIDLPSGAQLVRSAAARVRGAMQRAGATALVIGDGGDGPVFDGARVRLAMRGERGRIVAAIEKGGRNGAGATVTLRLERARLDDRPGTPVAEPTRRLPPGHPAGLRRAAGGAP